ncbi:MAG: hypothetical protein QM813_27410 [Verrucomicrobiota bacterium]
MKTTEDQEVFPRGRRGLRLLMIGIYGMVAMMVGCSGVFFVASGLSDLTKAGRPVGIDATTFKILVFPKKNDQVAAGRYPDIGGVLKGHV